MLLTRTQIIRIKDDRHEAINKAEQQTKITPAPTPAQVDYFEKCLNEIQGHNSITFKCKGQLKELELIKHTMDYVEYESKAKRIKDNDYKAMHESHNTKKQLREDIKQFYCFTVDVPSINHINNTEQLTYHYETVDEYVLDLTERINCARSFSEQQAHKWNSKVRITRL